MDFFKNITFFTTGFFATLFWGSVCILILVGIVKGCEEAVENMYEAYEKKQTLKQMTYAEYIIVDMDGRDVKYSIIDKNGELFRNDECISLSCYSIMRDIEEAKSTFIEYCNISKANKIDQYSKVIKPQFSYYDNGYGVIYKRINGKDYLVINEYGKDICIPKANIDGFISFLKKGEEIRDKIRAKEDAKRKEEERINSLYEKEEVKKVSEKKSEVCTKNYTSSSDNYEYYTNKEATEVVEEDLDESKIFDLVEEMPQFPGGVSAMFEYIDKNKRYPIVAEENEVQGRVIVTFVVEINGEISDCKIVKSADPSLDREAKRVVSSMPHWIPAKQNGHAVRCKYTVPITFTLE